MPTKLRRQHPESAIKKWTNPVKDHPAKESTLNTTGDFGQFKELMRKVVAQKPSSSHGPASS